MWQELIIGLMVIVALAYLGKKYFSKSKPSQPGCDKCVKS